MTADELYTQVTGPKNNTKLLDSINFICSPTTSKHIVMVLINSLYLVITDRDLGLLALQTLLGAVFHMGELQGKQQAEVEMLDKMMVENKYNVPERKP